MISRRLGAAIILAPFTSMDSHACRVGTVMDVASRADLILSASANCSTVRENMMPSG